MQQDWLERGVIFAEDFPETSRIFLGVDFFRNPPEGFTIHWTDGVTPGGLCAMVRNGRPCNELCMAGVLVKLVDPPVVWRLTGNAQRRDEGAISRLLSYEAVWPD